LVIISVPREQLPTQDLPSCDYFSEQQENVGPDTCMVVGEISKIVPTLFAFDILLKPNYLSETTNHQM
jgi:hypothetical protein